MLNIIVVELIKPLQGRTANNMSKMSVTSLCLNDYFFSNLVRLLAISFRFAERLKRGASDTHVFVKSYRFI